MLIIAAQLNTSNLINFTMIALGAGMAISSAIWLWARHIQYELEMTAQFDSLELGGIPLDGDVKFFGQAEAGSTGLLQSPITGTNCVWHKVKVTEYWQKTVSDGDDSSHTETESRTLYENSSVDNILLRDDKGGVYLLPDGLEFRGVQQSYSQQHDSFEIPNLGMTWRASHGPQLTITLGSSRPDNYLEVQEYILTASSTAMVLAQVGQDQNGTRFLHDQKKSRHSFLQPTASPEQFAADFSSSKRKKGYFAVAFTAAFVIMAGVKLLIH